MGPFKVMAKVGMTSYRLVLPNCYRLYPVFHCDLLPHTTITTSLRTHQAEIEGDMEEYAFNYIDDVKLDNLPRRRGPYLQFFTYVVNFDTPECMLVEQVDDFEEPSKFFTSQKWTMFFLGKIIWNLLTNIPKELLL